MNKYKVCVYAICKNEEKNLEQWIENVSEADKVFVLDTGSTDNSLKILSESKVIYKQINYENFRFDVARNDSLNMVDEDCDICVCLDIDERFIKGWRKIVEDNWEKHITMLKYRYTWSYNIDGTEGTVYYMSKIHSRHDYKWFYPVHEVLKYNGNDKENIKVVNNLKIFHFADKNKSRSSYLPLLELAYKENPNDDRVVHYLGREYMFYKQYEKAIYTFNLHLNLKSSLWHDERAASYRYIARCYNALDNIELAKTNYYKAIVESPKLRESYVELAFLLFQIQDYYGVIYFINEALKIKERSITYLNEANSWDATPYDLLSLAYYYLNDKQKALYYVNKALEFNKNNVRLNNNKEIFSKMN